VVGKGGIGKGSHNKNLCNSVVVLSSTEFEQHFNPWCTDYSLGHIIHVGERVLIGLGTIL